MSVFCAMSAVEMDITIQTVNRYFAPFFSSLSRMFAIMHMWCSATVRFLLLLFSHSRCVCLKWSLNMCACKDSIQTIKITIMSGSFFINSEFVSIFTPTLSLLYSLISLSFPLSLSRYLSTSLFPSDLLMLWFWVLLPNHITHSQTMANKCESIKYIMPLHTMTPNTANKISIKIQFMLLPSTYVLWILCTFHFIYCLFCCLIPAAMCEIVRSGLLFDPCATSNTHYVLWFRITCPLQSRPTQATAQKKTGKKHSKAYRMDELCYWKK